MQFDLSALPQTPFQVQHSLPTGYTGYLLPGSKVITLTAPSIGTLVQQQFANSHYTIRHHLFHVLEPFRLKAMQSAARLNSFLSIRNTLDYEIEGVGSLKLKQGQFALLHSGDGAAVLNFLKPKIYEAIEIDWTDDCIRSVMHMFHFLQTLFEPVDNNRKGFFVHGSPRPAGIKALDIARDILSSPFEDPLVHQFFLRIKASEYMMMLFIEAQKKDSRLAHLSEKQRDVLIALGNKVRGIFNRQLSIAELSREANMNSTSFKRGFQEINGDSPSKLQMKARMEKAVYLLSESELSPKQIAEEVGYATSANFLRQFQEYYKYPASSVIRKHYKD